jgi:hypothetical protein
MRQELDYQALDRISREKALGVSHAAKVSIRDGAAVMENGIVKKSSLQIEQFQILLSFRDGIAKVCFFLVAMKFLVFEERGWKILAVESAG